MTLRRRLIETKIHCYVPAYKELMTPALDLLWSTSRMMEINDDISPLPMRSCSSQQYPGFSTAAGGPIHVIKKRTMSGRVAVSFQGWMCAYNPGELVMINGHLTRDKYVEILDQLLLPIVRCMPIPASDLIKLVHDQSPIHNSKIVSVWLQDHPELVLHYLQ